MGTVKTQCPDCGKPLRPKRSWGGLLACFCRWTPPSRQIFIQDYQTYRFGGFSFRRLTNPVDRARATFYRHHFSFGGKTRCGGFSVSLNDRSQIKEVARYRNSLRRLVRLAQLFRDTLIEGQHYSDVIRQYGRKEDVCLFVDPPYVGTENYYSCLFSRGDHVFLSQQLSNCLAQCVVTYYDDPLLRELYPETAWEWHSIRATKNSGFRSSKKPVTSEMVITKRLKKTP